jgi:uncharacterized membrane protein
VPDIDDFLASSDIRNLLFILSAVWVVGVSLASLGRHRAYYSNLWDLGWQEQVVWNSARGRWLQSSMRGDAGGKFLGDHVTLTPVYLAPLYRLRPRTETLLVAQAVILASGAVLLFHLARVVLGSSPAAFLIGVSYLVSPLPVNIATYDLHEITLVVPILAALFLALVKDRFRATLLLTLLALTVKEEVALTVAALGLVAVGWQKKRFGILMAAAAAIWFVTAVGFSSKLFPPGPLLRRGHRYPLSLAPHLEALPWKLRYLGGMMAVFGFLPPFGVLVFLAATPALIYNFASTYGPQLVWRYHYQTILLIPLFAASVFAIARLAGLAGRRFGWPRSEMVLAGSAWLLAVNLFAAAATRTIDVWGFWRYRPPIGKRALVRSEAVRLIPPAAAVAAGNSLGAHLARRERLYDFPRFPFRGDWVVFDTWKDVDQGFEGLEFYRRRVRELEERPDYRLVADYKNVF